MEAVQGQAMNNFDLSVVLPVYNEDEAVGGVIVDIVDVLSDAGLTFEVVAVNDGSRDCSEAVLQDLQQKYPEYLRIATHTINKGNGAALRTGIRLARGEIVVCMDADGQHQGADILQLLEKIPPFDMVVGARTETYMGKWYRNLANRFYNRFASWLTQYPVLDLTSGFRAIRRNAVLHFLPIYPAGFSSPTTVTMAFLKAGYSVAYVPTQVRARTLGKSKINLFKDGRRFFLIILRMVMLFDPLRIFFPVSLLLFLLGMITMVFGIWAAGRMVVPGSSVVLFIAAVLTVLLGLVSSQISNSMIPYYGDEYVHLCEAPAAQIQSSEESIV
jgi:glycosyltransferase involved in cell wall biosynthesis